MSLNQITMEDKTDDLNARCESSGIGSRKAYLTAVVFAVVAWGSITMASLYLIPMASLCLITMNSTECTYIIDIIQSDDLTSKVYDAASKVDSYMVVLYVVSYLIWVILVIYMILYKMCTAECKIHRMKERFAMVSPVLVAICLIVPFAIGLTQLLLIVVLGIMVAYNILLDHRYYGRMSGLQKCQLFFIIVTCLVAVIEEVVSMDQTPCIKYFMLYVSLFLILVAAALTDLNKKNDGGNQ